MPKKWRFSTEQIIMKLREAEVLIAQRYAIPEVAREPDSPWENGYIESFNGRMRDELLAGEIFYSLKEAQVLIEMWRKPYNTARPHSSLAYQPPVPETVVPLPPIPRAMKVA